jgi:plastocyanin
MRNESLMTRRAIIVMLVGLVGAMLMSLSGPSVSAESPAQTLPEQRIEIVIRDYDFQILKPTPIQPGLPTVIILRNQDIVRHGFYSAMLQGILVQGEGEGVAAYGKGVEGFYVDPGKTLVIRFNNQRAGKYSFRCDLHPSMKGEAYVMEVPVA